MTPEELALFKQLTGAVERIAAHLTKPPLAGGVPEAVSTGEWKPRFYGDTKPQQESNHDSKVRPIRRPKQASRS